MRRPRLPLQGRSPVVLLPSGATQLNLFFGIFAIVSASRGDFGKATLFVVLGGVADMLDGRIARATGTGSRFGEELDSLVDAITFGLAPALIMYFKVLSQQGWDWVFVFIYTACAVTRLARFNVEQAGKAKTHFHGLPSPAAGMTLATYIWFAQTPFYNQAVIFFTDNTTLADLNWHTTLRYLMLGLAYLMVSDVPYFTVPSIGVRNLRQIIGTVIVAGGLLGLVFLPRHFFFPVLLAYVVFGVVQWAVLGFLERPAASPDIYLEDEPDDDDPPRRMSEPATAVATPSTAGAQRAAPDEDPARQRRRRRRRRRPDGGSRGDSSADSVE